MKPLERLKKMAKIIKEQKEKSIVKEIKTEKKQIENLPIFIKGKLVEK